MCLVGLSAVTVWEAETEGLVGSECSARSGSGCNFIYVFSLTTEIPAQLCVYLFSLRCPFLSNVSV